MEFLYELGSVLASILPLSFWDFLDMFVLWFVVYMVLRYMKETRAVGLTKGLVILVAAYLAANLLKMKAVLYLLNKAMDVGLVAIIVLFAPEIRRFLENIGHSRVTRINVYKSDSSSRSELNSKWMSAIEVICEAVDDLSANAVGALIVIEREVKVTEQIDMGPIINAIPSKELFGTIFYVGTPLHDGAVIMREGLVYAAACFLPMPQSGEGIDNKLHSRHRAAIGMSENAADAIVIVVSEEHGTISIAEKGKLTPGYTKDTLKSYLLDNIIVSDSSKKNSKSSGEKKSLFRRKK